MTSPLQSNAEMAGTLISSSRFNIPSFQREYSWKDDKVLDLWEDLSSNISSENYFLGLIILTEKGKVKKVIDGQQRLVTLTLLAKAMSNKAKSLDQIRLAEQIESTFLRYMNYTNQRKFPRISFTEKGDDETFKAIINSNSQSAKGFPKGATSSQMKKSFDRLSGELDAFLNTHSPDYLGKLTDFLVHRLYFAVFVHPDDSSAFRIFEVINTRGQGLTQADLLKNYIIGEAYGEKEEKKFYKDWKYVSSEIKEIDSGTAGNLFVQYIRHVAIEKYGHIPAKDLYDVLTGTKGKRKYKMPAPELLALLKNRLPLYRQMVDPTLYGPAGDRELEIFSAFKSLNVSSVRPMLISLFDLEDGVKGMEYLLQIVVRLMVVESIGTGKIESKFGDVSEMLLETKDWSAVPQCLSELDPKKDQFVSQLIKRSLPKRTLTFVRRSALQRKRTPETIGEFHWVMPKYRRWSGIKAGESNFVTSLGNSILASTKTLPKEASKSWDDFKHLLPNFALDEELTKSLRHCVSWDAKEIEAMGRVAAEKAADVWY